MASKFKADCSRKMMSSVCPNLIYAAIRIYLTHTLHETEQLLRGYEMRQRVAITAVAKSDWNCVVAAAESFILYIRNCQYDDQINQFTTYGPHGLCAIEAAQDALASALHVAQSCRQELNSVPHPHEQRMWNQTTRAKYIVNFMVAQRLRDKETARLWDSVVQQTHLQMQGRLSGDAFSLWQNCSSNIANAVRLTTLASKQAHSAVAELQLRAARNYRLCFLHSVLGRTNYCNKAAEAFETASGYCSKGAQCNTAAKVLWDKASAAVVLAAEMMARGAWEKDCALSPGVRYATYEADTYAAKAEYVAEYISDLETIYDQCTQQPGPIEVKNKLAAMREHVQKLLLRYVNQPIGADHIMDDLQVELANMQVVADVGEEIIFSLERSECYRIQAVQCNHIAHGELRKIWSECWTLAAKCMEEAARLETQAVVSVESGTPLLVTQLPGQVERTKAQMYEYCTSNIIGGALRYYNFARGARASQYDAREAQWWHAASDGLIQTTIVYMEHISLSTISSPTLPPLPAAAAEAVNLANMYARAAENLANARKCRESMQAETSHSTVRAVELYTLAADLTIATLVNDQSLHSTIRHAADFCTKLAKMIVSGDDVSCDGTDAMEKGCGYICNFFTALTTSKLDVAKWKAALDFLFDPAQKDHFRFYGERIQGGFAASGALHVSAAEQWNAGNKVSSNVFTYAAKMINNTESHIYESKRTSRYRVELMQRVCSTCNTTCEVPAELEDLPGMTQAERSVDSWLDEHVNACIAEIECTSELSSAAADSAEAKKWQSAQSEARALCDFYLLYTRSRHDDPEDRRRESANTLVRIALQKRVLQRSISAVRDQHVF